MTPKRLKELAEIISELEQAYKQPYIGVSGGFAIGKYLLTEDEIIHITIRYGVQSDCTNNTYDDLVYLDKNTLKRIDADGIGIEDNQPKSSPVLRIIRG